MATANILTAQGRDNLLEELAWREGEKKEEIIERIREARDFGDLSENSEWDAAKEEQSKNESRIKEIKDILAKASIVEDSDEDDPATKGVSINCEVEVEDNKGKTHTFTLVGTTETDSLNGKISGESPLGEALSGAFVDDVIEFTTPSGQVRTYTIKAIRKVAFSASR